MHFAYPLMLDVEDRLAVIIGGGGVAARKAKGLIEAGARRIHAIAPTFSDAMPAAVVRIGEIYHARHLEGAGLVFAATDSPAVNDQVVRDARARGILVNRSDEGEAGGDFASAAVHRDGEVIVTVSAGSAALAAAIRDDLRARLDPRHVKMADAMQSLRPAIRDSGLSPDRRQAIFRDLVGEEALAALDAGGVDQLRRWLKARYPDLTI